ncbi:MAG: putative porin [Balneolaceae bacterium]|nr:putative porin [Balneolaceae bacterium]
MSSRLETYLVVLLWSLSATTPLRAQVNALPVETRPDTVAGDTVAADTLLNAPPSVPLVNILPWEYHHGIGYRTVSNDSLLRWQTWPDWTYKMNRDPGTITFRLGTIGRSNTALIGAHEPRHQELYWEDIPMHNRVSGTVNWNVMPIHKIRSVQEHSGGIVHRTNYYLRNYYVNKPLTKLIFDESKFNRRALEFWITQNFSQKTNVELSFWDRRAGGGYNNSSFTGNQIWGRVYHQYDNQQFFKLRFLTGKRDLGEPFGYDIPDLDRFAFNRFNTPAVESSGKSSSGFTTLALSYHRRPEDTVAVTERFRAGLFMNNQKREVSYSADTTFTQLNSVGGYARKWLELHPFSIEGQLRYELFSNKQPARSSLQLDSWSSIDVSGSLAVTPFRGASISGSAALTSRKDMTGYSFGGNFEFAFWDRLRLQGGVSSGTHLPSLQQLYWSSDEYSGSPGLDPEQISEAHTTVSYSVLKGLEVGTRGQYKQISDGIMLNDQNRFVNIDRYEAVSATGFADFESTHFELSGSGTVQQYRNAIPDQSSGVPVFNTTRIWLKGRAYWKGYLFDRATYVKAGFAGMLSPSGYRPEHYDTALDYWQPASTDQQLPWFSRLDFDLSARVRSIIFVLRYENILDEVSQLGYFETAGYPMAPRRFLFGVRALFNN